MIKNNMSITIVSILYMNHNIGSINKNELLTNNRSKRLIIYKNFPKSKSKQSNKLTKIDASMILNARYFFPTKEKKLKKKDNLKGYYRQYRSNIRPMAITIHPPW